MPRQELKLGAISEIKKLGSEIMSEDKQKKGFWAFWTTLPGILTEIAAVIVAIGTVIKACEPFQNSTETSAADSTQIAPKTEELVVYANSQKGKSYTNNKYDYLKLQFTTKGEWLAIPESNDNPNIPESAKGYISPQGDPNFFSNDNVPCRRFPMGALVVVSEERQCLAYGKQGSFELKKGETAYFLMNDVIRDEFYEDNKGYVNVELSIMD